MLTQKFDMHCHTREGSFDAHVPIARFAQILKDKGFSGMVVTDHDSYGGFEHWKKHKNDEPYPENFVILKGVEYSTRNAGHFVVVMPDNIESDFLTVKGMNPVQLEHEVHRFGGILGPAHPYMPGPWAFCNTWFGKNNPDFLEKVDFIETYNSTINPLLNVRAELLATRYKKPGTGGCDAHFLKDVGNGFVSFSGFDIQCNNDLIKALKSGRSTDTGGDITAKMLRRKNIVTQKFMDGTFWLYNNFCAMKNRRRLNSIISQTKAYRNISGAAAFNHGKGEDDV